MSSSWGILIILLIVLGGSFLFLVRAEKREGRDAFEFIGSELRQFKATVWEEDENGELKPAKPTVKSSRFNQGVCKTASDCVISGCSGEVCGSEEVVTTCEYSEAFPGKDTHFCGCVDGMCSWAAK